MAKSPTVTKKVRPLKRVSTTALDKDIAKKLAAQGLDRVIYSEAAFDPYSAISEFKPKVENVKTLRLGHKIQTEFLDEMFANPLKAQTICISSFPSDIRAKALAAKLMEEAMKRYLSMSPQQQIGKTLPYWHRLLGGYKDPIRDAPNTKRKPSFLIISNVNMESTPMKLEKLRDLLDLHPDIPRVVVTGGVNPVDFFQHKLFYPLDKMVFLGSANRVGGSSIMDL